MHERGAGYVPVLNGIVAGAGMGTNEMLPAKVNPLELDM